MYKRNVLVPGFCACIGKIFAAFLVLFLSAIPALPKDDVNVVPAGNWGAIDSLTPGTEISVRMVFGDRIDGSFLDLDSEGIHLIIGEKERIYPRSGIAEIRQLRMPDRKLNGTLIGMGTGAAGGIAGMVAFANAKTNGPVYWDEDGGAFLAGAALVGAGIGALAGAIVDASIKGDKLLYRRLPQNQTVRHLHRLIHNPRVSDGHIQECRMHGTPENGT